MDKLSKRFYYYKFKEESIECPLLNIESEYCETQNCNCFSECKLYQMLYKLAEYEDTEEQGLLIKLPPDGQIYHIEECEETGERWIGNKPCHYITSEGYYCGWGIASICFSFDELGKTVFLNRKDAEDKLNELHSSKNI